MSQYDFDRDGLHLLLGTLIHAYARLDHFMGLQLKWLGEYRGRPVTNLLRKNVGFDRRLKLLRELSIETWAHSDAKIADEFRAWFKEVERVQKQRNRFAHGRWGYVHKESGEVGFVDLSWERDPDKMKPPVQVALREFKRLASEVECLSGQFMALQDKHMARARYKKEWEDANPEALATWAKLQMKAPI
ncbi:hypothetical protein [Variovorax sp. YR216]|uniref:hypothetical protein n=1 Tax=Variovorax sp. YR216 TaxID=1882828 RepID=UPI00089D3D2A|nr:hypothetical protein [Variovorax sp. YR216]SEA67706.1 hypothetical protein SAMN05444680_10379 [Variovorax sp. YR216]